MYIVYRTTADGSKYASAAVSKRAGAKTSITYTYLGRVLDEKAGIYQNAKRGVFKFDPKTNTFSDTDASAMQKNLLGIRIPNQTDFILLNIKSALQIILTSRPYFLSTN